MRGDRLDWYVGQLLVHELALRRSDLIGVDRHTIHPCHRRRGVPDAGVGQILGHIERRRCQPGPNEAIAVLGVTPATVLGEARMPSANVSQTGAGVEAEVPPPYRPCRIDPAAVDCAVAFRTPPRWNSVKWWIPLACDSST